MALTSTTLVVKFDFTRFIPGIFSGWGNGHAKYCDVSNDLFYYSQVILGNASYANGCIICRTSLTEDDLINEWKAEEDDTQKQYATFKIIDGKNKRLVETSCSPQHIVNYFTKSDFPWEISPAFFDLEVLVRFKNDPEKYSFFNKSISCRNAWNLKEYDINEVGQVHVYVGDLAKLPYKEQLYWKSFNERSKAGISKRAFENDILGEISSEEDPLDSLKATIAYLDESLPAWWKRRGPEMIDEVHYPATDSVTEWGDELLSLDQLLVEGFQVKSLRKVADSYGASYEKNGGL